MNCQRDEEKKNEVCESFVGKKEKSCTGQFISKMEQTYRVRVLVAMATPSAISRAVFITLDRRVARVCVYMLLCYFRSMICSNTLTWTHNSWCAIVDSRWPSGSRTWLQR